VEEVEVCDGGRGGVGMGLDHGGSGEGMKWDGARECKTGFWASWLG